MITKNGDSHPEESNSDFLLDSQDQSKIKVTNVDINFLLTPKP